MTARQRRCRRRFLFLGAAAILIALFGAYYAPYVVDRMRPEPEPTPPRGGLNPAALKTIHSLCEKALVDGAAPGIVLVVGRGDVTLIRKAYGLRMAEPKREAMTVDTLFDLASLTKPTCTAVAAMLLVQDGVLSLDDPVARHVPEFDRKGKKEITIGQLLTHTSGMAAYTNAAETRRNHGPRPNPEGLIRRISRLNDSYDRGKGYVYSCLNYLTLARVVQNASGQNMSIFLRDRVWEPLGMTDTTFYPTDEQIARTAPTVNNGKEYRRGLVHDPLAHYSVCPAYAPGNAGAFSTARDLEILVRLLLEGGELNGRRILERPIWEKMTTDQTGMLAANRSCGWGIVTDKALSTPLNRTPETACLLHTGYTGTLIWMDKFSKAYVIFLSNCVYPTDDAKRKNATIATRRKIIETVVRNLDVYEDVVPAGT